MMILKLDHHISGAKAHAMAETYAREHGTTTYVFWDFTSNRYTISDMPHPYLRIFDWEYIPEMVASYSYKNTPMIQKLEKGTLASEAITLAENYSKEHNKTVYVFRDDRNKQYTISDIDRPYAPIFAGGYVPSMIGSFTYKNSEDDRPVNSGTGEPNLPAEIPGSKP